MKIIGIDPGLNKTGWGVISVENNNFSYVTSGLVVNNIKSSFSDKLSNINFELEKILECYKPNIGGIEKTFVNRNPLSSLKLGHARGVALLTIKKFGIEVNEYSPNLIKKTVTGAGKADKTQVMTMVKLLLPSSNVNSEDEADALAVALCCGSLLKKY
ncbi:crossover junction endodeoxyribonuclease RuvC [Pseudomonadota bacterium]